MNGIYIFNNTDEKIDPFKEKRNYKKIFGKGDKRISLAQYKENKVKIKELNWYDKNFKLTVDDILEDEKLLNEYKDYKCRWVPYVKYNVNGGIVDLEFIGNEKSKKLTIDDIQNEPLPKNFFTFPCSDILVDVEKVKGIRGIKDYVQFILDNYDDVRRGTEENTLFINDSNTINGDPRKIYDFLDFIDELFRKKYKE